MEPTPERVLLLCGFTLVILVLGMAIRFNPIGVDGVTNFLVVMILIMAAILFLIGLLLAISMIDR